MIYVIAEVILHNGSFYRPVNFSDAALAYLLRTQGLFFKKTKPKITQPTKQTNKKKPTEQDVVQWD